MEPHTLACEGAFKRSKIVSQGYYPLPESGSSRILRGVRARVITLSGPSLLLFEVSRPDGMERRVHCDCSRLIWLFSSSAAQLYSPPSLPTPRPHLGGSQRNFFRKRQCFRMHISGPELQGQGLRRFCNFAGHPAPSYLLLSAARSTCPRCHPTASSPFSSPPQKAYLSSHPLPRQQQPLPRQIFPAVWKLLESWTYGRAGSGGCCWRLRAWVSHCAVGYRTVMGGAAVTLLQCLVERSNEGFLC